MAVVNTPEDKPLRKLTAFDLKLALLEYYRFTRQWICVDECMQADVVADSGTHIIEVEVKISKQDLIKGEGKKRNKHQNYEKQWYGYAIPNKYYFCVPTELEDIAIEYAQELNPKYGVIVYSHRTRQVLTVKRARLLHDEYKKTHVREIAKRCSAKLITLMQKEHYQKDKQ